MILKCVLSLFVASITSLSSAMDHFDHKSSFTCNKMRETYQEVCNISNEELIKRFKACSINGQSFDNTINVELENIVRNSTGRETLQLVVARLYPFVRCANTLEHLLNVIPETKQTHNYNILKKAKMVVLFCDALNLRGQDVFMTFLNVNTSLSKLKTDPVLFPSPDTPYRKGSLLEVFKDDTHTEDTEKKSYIVSEINMWWNRVTKQAVEGILPILKEGMFSLTFDLSTKYTYDLKAHSAKISLSNTCPSISARCITGPLLHDRIDDQDITVCYELQDRVITADSGLHHEIFHHLTIGLELEEFPSFSRLIPCLISNMVDRLYIVNLKEIYTDMDEFRNIIGIFVDKKNHVFFDPCSEAAYLCSAGQCIRGTHKSSTRGIIYIPISFVEFIKRAKINGFIINENKCLKDCSKVSWR